MAKKVEMMLPVPITQDERLSYGKELSDLVNQEHVKEEEKKAVSSRMGEEVKTLHANVLRVNEILTSGYVRKLVPCVMKVNLPKQEMWTIRTDTDKRVLARKMTDNEVEAARQGKLFNGKVFESEEEIEFVIEDVPEDPDVKDIRGGSKVTVAR